MPDFTENDWKLFRSKIVDWQEAYMEKLNKQYIEILTANKYPSDKFWELEERINEDKKKSGVILEMRRSCFIRNIVHLINDGVIGVDDIKEFSDELKKSVHFFIDNK